jgi:hypothetical protein
MLVATLLLMPARLARLLTLQWAASFGFSLQATAQSLFFVSTLTGAFPGLRVLSFSRDSSPSELNRFT